MEESSQGEGGGLMGRKQSGFMGSIVWSLVGSMETTWRSIE